MGRRSRAGTPFFMSNVVYGWCVVYRKRIDVYVKKGVYT
jgi:hypothetical protein